MVNYYRIEEAQAYELVFDHTNDKGIDGIFVDNDTREVILFQSKFRKSFSKGEGDGDIRKFYGSSAWFTPENIARLGSSRATKELKDLVKQSRVFELLNEGYERRLVYITSGFFDSNAKEYIGTVENKIDCWDKNRLFENYTYSGNDELVSGSFTFQAIDKVIKNEYQESAYSYLFTTRADELLKLDGIIDRTLFSKNVRFGLGRTNVNKAITKTIQDKTQHKKFVLFHNGITIIAQEAKLMKNSTALKVHNYSIVNGCQSTLTLYENREFISKDLAIAIKVVETGANTRLAEDITYFANNQNPINPADLKSREKFQLDLQKGFKDTFGDTVHYEIKRGEDIPANAEVIENTFAAQLLYSFMNESPFDAHLKSSLFSKHYSEIFTRHVDVHRIYFLKTLFDLIQENIGEIREPIVRAYLPSKFFILYLVKKVMAEDKAGLEFIQSPKQAVKKYESTFFEAFRKLIRILIIQFNSDLENLREEDGYVDYKNILRNTTEGRKLGNEVIKGYKMVLVHQPYSTLTELLKSE